MNLPPQTLLIPAKAGTQMEDRVAASLNSETLQPAKAVAIWVPAFAGMSKKRGVDWSQLSVRRPRQ